MQDNTYILPSDEKAERVVISEVLHSTNSYYTILAIITTVEVFFNSLCKKIWTAIQSCVHNGRTADMIMVVNELKTVYPGDKTNWALELAVICDNYSPLPEVIEKAHYLVALFQKRQLLAVAGQLQKFALSGDLEVGSAISDTNDELLKILQTDCSSEVKSMADVCDELTANMDANMNGVGLKSIPLFPGIEAHEGELVVVAAESGVGKTSFALSCAKNVAEAGFPTTIYSLEMKSLLLGARIVASASGITSSHIVYCPLSVSEQKKVDDAIAGAYNLPIYFDDKSIVGIDSIISSTRKMVIKYGVKVAMVDYLQILPQNGTHGHSTEEQVLADMARRLKNLATELGICIIALSQLSRDKDNPYPSVNRLRGSGQILEAADLSVMIYRPENVENGRDNRYSGDFEVVDPHGTALIILGKNRNGGKSKFICGFNAELTAFYPLEEHQIPKLAINKKPGSIV